MLDSTWKYSKNTGVFVSSKSIFQMNCLAHVLVGSFKAGVPTVVTEDGDLNTEKHSSECNNELHGQTNHKKLLLLFPMPRSSSIWQNWDWLLLSSQGLNNSSIYFGLFWKTKRPKTTYMVEGLWLNRTQGTGNLQTFPIPRRPLFLHVLSFECTKKLCINFLNQFSVYFHI